MAGLGIQSHILITTPEELTNTCNLPLCCNSLAHKTFAVAQLERGALKLHNYTAVQLLGFISKATSGTWRLFCLLRCLWLYFYSSAAGQKDYKRLRKQRQGKFTPSFFKEIRLAEAHVQAYTERQRWSLRATLKRRRQFFWLLQTRKLCTLKLVNSWKVYASAQWGYEEKIFTGKNMDYLYHFL